MKTYKVVEVSYSKLEDKLNELSEDEWEIEFIIKEKAKIIITLSQEIPTLYAHRVEVG